MGTRNALAISLTTALGCFSESIAPNMSGPGGDDDPTGGDATTAAADSSAAAVTSSASELDTGTEAGSTSSTDADNTGAMGDAVVLGPLIPSENLDDGAMYPAGDGYLDNVHALRDTYAADVVSLVIESNVYCGIGYVNSTAASAWVRSRSTGCNPLVWPVSCIYIKPDVALSADMPAAEVKQIIQRSIAAIAASTQASRAICYACGAAAELAEHAADAATREAAKLREDLLTPLAKGWSTDRAVDATNAAVQVYGGMGFMGETAAAQYYLDARITPIYEGTNGIQAIDLVGRKLSMNNGAAMTAMLSDIRDTAREARATNKPRFVAIADRLDAGAGALDEATQWMAATMKSARETALSGATSYLRLAGDVVGGHFLTRAALSGQNSQEAERSLALASFFAEDTLSKAPGSVATITAAAQALREAGSVLWSA